MKFIKHEQATIFKQLAQAQAEFSSIIKNKEVKKQQSSNGKTFGGYAYADIGTVLEAIQPALNKYNLFLSQNPQIENDRFKLVTAISNENGEVLELGNIDYNVSGANPQDLGKIITYLRRYSLLACFGLASEDDDGLDASKRANMQFGKYQEPRRQEPAVTFNEEKEKLAQKHMINHYLNNQANNQFITDEIRNFCTSEIKKEDVKLGTLVNVVEKLANMGCTL